MTISEVVSLTIAVAAVLFSAIQTISATKAVNLSQQLERGNAVIHFTNQFSALVHDSLPDGAFSDLRWAAQFWSLHATEFYFFHHGILPVFMYTLWMIDLAELYSGQNGTQARESHLKHLRTYSFNYPEMVSFFHDIYEKARTCSDDNMRNREVAGYVTAWIAQNKRSRLN
jgi:hypothetical protein